MMVVAFCPKLRGLLGCMAGRRTAKGTSVLCYETDLPVFVTGRTFSALSRSRSLLVKAPP